MPFFRRVRVYRPKRWSVPSKRAAVTVSVGGTLTTSGALLKQDQKRLAGTLTTAGAVTKAPARSLAGTLTSAGALTKIPARLLGGTLATAGSVASLKSKLLSLAGTLTMSGAYRGVANLLRGGVLTTAGALIKQGRRFLSGVLTTVGSLSSSTPGTLPFRDDFVGAISGQWDENDGEGVLNVVNNRAFFEKATTADGWNDPALISPSFGRTAFGAYSALVRLTNNADTGKGFKVAISPSSSDPDAAGSASLTWSYPDLRTPGYDEAASNARQRSKDVLLTLIKRESGGFFTLISEGTSGGEWPVFPQAQIVNVSEDEVDAAIYAHLAARRGRAHVDYATVLEDADRPSAFTTRFGPALASEASGTRTAGTSSITNCGAVPRIIEATLTRGANNDTRAVVCFRGSSSSYANCWKFKGEFDRFSLHDTSGVQTQNGGSTMPATTATKLRVVDFGNRIDCYANGVRVLTWSSTTGAGNTFAGTACDTGASLSVTVANFGAWGQATLTADFGPFPEVPRSALSASVTDAFTDANATSLPTHNPDWTVHSGTWEINSNRARMTAAGVNGIATRTAGTANHEVSAVIGLPADAWTYPDDVFAGVFARYTDANNYVYARLLWQDGPSPEVELWEMSGGVSTLLNYVNLTGTIVSAGDYTLALAVSGAEAAAYLNGECVVQSTTSVLSGVRAGIGVVDTNRQGQPTWDDFSIKLIGATAVSLSGALTTSGALTKQDQKRLAGTLTSSAAVRKQTNRTLTGSLTSAGAITRRVGKALSGTLATAGALLKQVRRTLTGSLTGSGALTSSKLKFVSRAGTLTASGAISTHLIRGRQVSGTLVTHGAMDLLVIRQPVLPPPEFTPVDDGGIYQAPLVGEAGVPQAGLVGEDDLPEFIPRS